MLTGDKAPLLALPGVFSGKRETFDLAKMRGSWVVVIFYPADFSFICPTEIGGFSRAMPEFSKLGAKVLGCSADTLESHEEWTRELGDCKFPLLSDTSGETIRAWGAGDPEEPPRAQRATFIVDPAGKIDYLVISQKNVGRSVEETLRVLRALQTGRLCPVDWQPGEKTLD